MMALFYLIYRVSRGASVPTAPISEASTTC